MFYRNRTKLSLSRCDGTPGRGIQGSLRHCIRDRKVSESHRFPSNIRIRCRIFIVDKQNVSYRAIWFVNNNFRLANILNCSQDIRDGNRRIEFFYVIFYRWHLVEFMRDTIIANIVASRRVGHAVSEFDTICILALRNDYTSCLETMHASGGVEDSEEHGISVSKNAS